MNRRKIEDLKRHLINILHVAGFTEPIGKIHLTLKEGKIGPNIKIFFKNYVGFRSDYIFLSEWRHEKTEEELFKLLSETKNIEDLKNINPRARQDLSYLL